MNDLLDIEQMTKDIKKSRDILENITSQKVIGYRAPSFSINDNVIQVLGELGFKYDSSYNPFKWNNRYGQINSPLKKISSGCYQTQHGIYEVPMSTLSFFNLNFPVGGGAYFRIMPFFIFKRLVNLVVKNKEFYNFYLHPWEFEVNQERVKNIKWQYKFRHYYGLHRTEEKLEKLIMLLKESDCNFLTVKDYVNRVKTNSL